MLPYAGVSRRNGQWDDPSGSNEVKEASANIMTTLVCPEKKHTSLRHPCRCLYLLRLNVYLQEKVFYSWHSDENLPLTSFELNQPATASRGGQGVVFYVHQIDVPEKRFALKFKDRMERRGNMWELEKREADILSQVRHPFIVKMLHCYETARGLFMAFEYLGKGSLWSHICKHGPLPESSAIYFSAAVVDALHFLHDQDIIYRDLKTENVVLDDMGRPRLIDFGLSKPIGARGDNCPMTRYDFVSYLAPEIYRNPEKCDNKVDSWGVGFLLCELLLGYGIIQDIPWEDNTASHHLAEDWKLNFPPEDTVKLSQPCLDIIHALLCRQPEARPNMNETKLAPFFSSVRWQTLSSAQPPDDPFSCEELIYPASSSDSKQAEKVSEEEVKADESKETISEVPYRPLPNVPTVGCNSNLLYANLRMDAGLRAPTLFLQQPRKLQPPDRRCFYRSIGNL